MDNNSSPTKQSGRKSPADENVMQSKNENKGNIGVSEVNEKRENEGNGAGVVAKTNLSQLPRFSHSNLNEMGGSMALINLNINTTTGGNFGITVNPSISVENLKKIIAKKLKVSKDRISLLHREKELQEGTLSDNNILDGSKIILIPTVETGLLAQRPENTVMQALESLNDNQVNDFLSGKTPLNLSMRLGDHMMLIQLQLSTVNPAGTSTSGASSSRSRSYQRSGRSSHSVISLPNTNQQSSRHNKESTNIIFTDELKKCNASQKQDDIATDTVNNADLNSFLSKKDYKSLQSIVQNFAASHAGRCGQIINTNPNTKSGALKQIVGKKAHSLDTKNNSINLEQSPIKSLSNLVCSPIKASNLQVMPHDNNSSSCHDAIISKLTSCLCARLNDTVTNTIDNKKCVNNACARRQFGNYQMKLNENTAHVSILNQNPSTHTTLHSAIKPAITLSKNCSILHKTANNPISRSKHRQHNICCKSSSAQLNKASSSLPSSTTLVDERACVLDITSASPSTTNVKDLIETNSMSDVQTLAEASRNLTQTLRKLSKEVFTSKSDLSHRDETPRKNSGAVIESMKNHGKGIYSGTFSGTLNPALQDRFGRPKRDISTVIHILNDLLSATPQYSRTARINFESTSHSSGSNNHVLNPTLLRSKQNSSRHIHRISSSCVKCVKPNLSSSSTSTSAINHHNLKDRITCSCRYNLNPQTGERELEHTCQKCIVDMENHKTKSKLDQLRLIMMQSKQKREARKLKGAPYGARVVTAPSEAPSKSTVALNSQPNNISSLPSHSVNGDVNDVPPQHNLVEEVDTAA